VHPKLRIARVQLQRTCKNLGQHLGGLLRLGVVDPLQPERDVAAELFHRAVKDEVDVLDARELGGGLALFGPKPRAPRLEQLLKRPLVLDVALKVAPLRCAPAQAVLKVRALLDQRAHLGLREDAVLHKALELRHHLLHQHLHRVRHRVWAVTCEKTPAQIRFKIEKSPKFPNESILTGTKTSQSLQLLLKYFELL